MAAAQACCCLVSFGSHAETTDAMLRRTPPPPPSCLECVCLCNCGREADTPNVSPMAYIPELVGLTGVTVQDSSELPTQHTTNGSLQTLRFMPYDPVNRTLTMSVFGGRGSQPGTWAEPQNLTWACIMNMSRLCNFSYRFKFAEDLRSADITPLVNGCCCVPCLPPCVPLPACCGGRFDMVQTERSRDGTEWQRRNYENGKPQLYYYLRTVITEQGAPGPYHAALKRIPVPQKMQLTR